MNSEAEIGKEMHERIYSGDNFMRIFDSARQATTATFSTRSEEEANLSLTMYSSDSDHTAHAELETCDVVASATANDHMPHYEHFSFFQNVFFVRAQEDSNPTDAAEQTLWQIIEHMGDAEMTSPLSSEDFTCSLVLTPAKHSNIVPSLSKRDLRLGLTFSRIVGSS